MKSKIGYACQAIGVPQTAFGTCHMKQATQDNLYIKIKKNLEALDHILDYNIQNKIGLFRITSDLIPFGSSDVNNLEWGDIFQNEFILLGEKIRKEKIRVSMHPGQYTVLNSLDAKVVYKAVEDLRYHCKVLDLLGCEQSSKIILHIGGAYGNKKLAMQRFVQEYKQLDDNIKKRLVIENDDRTYQIDEVLEVSSQTGAPVIFDVLHHKINHSDQKIDLFEWIKLSKKTWKAEDGNQKIHYSEQNPLRQAGAHSEHIQMDTFLEFYKGLGREIPDIMLEVKDKNLSAVKCNNLVNPNYRIQVIEKEWSRYKYLILEHSGAHYQEVRELLKDKSAYPIIEFYRIIEEAMSIVPEFGSIQNASDHIWGYFSKRATKKEYLEYHKKLSKIQDKSGKIQAMKNYLLKLSEKYQEEYLIQSLYFYI